MSLSKYDHITNKRLICSGSPSVYHLALKKEEIGTVKKMTLGEKDPNKTNKTVLLVGETGAGKSTLINALVNYAMGVKWEDDVWFEVVEDDKERSDSQSQTSDVIVYEIFGFEDQTLPFSLTVIDTPGYGDIGGNDQGDIVSKRLFNLFHLKNGVHEINAVCLVLKAPECRLNDQLRFVFESAVSLFGKDMENKIVALLTYSDGVTPKNALKSLIAANVKCATDEENLPVHFLFNNCQNEDRMEDTEALQNAERITTKGVREFLNFLQKAAPQRLESTVHVLNEHITLTASIQNLQERVQLIEKQQKEIQQTQEALKKHQEEMKSDENFIVQVDEVYNVRERIQGGMWALVFYEGALCCNVCEENCHYPGCTIAWFPRDCQVMKRGRCTVCKGRCPVSAHVKEEKIFVTKTRKVDKILQDVKEKYERSKADHEKTTGLLEVLEVKMKTLQDEKDQWLDDAFQHVVKLEQIALSVDSLSTLGHLDFLMEKMREKEGGGAEMVQKLEEMKSRVDEEKRAGLRKTMSRTKMNG